MIRSYAGIFLLIAGFFAACEAEASDLSPGKIKLVNERPVTGPRVLLHLRYGSYYHPGVPFVLEGEVQVASSFAGEVRVQEGSTSAGPQYGQLLRFDASAPTRFRFPVCAPSAGANLVLSIWKHEGEGRSEVFRSRLASHLKGLSSREQVVLFCGDYRPLPGASSGWHVTYLAGAQMPEIDWMYENIDLVILARNAFGTKGLSEKSQRALRRWVLKGGKVLILSVSGAADVLVGAIRSGLLPIKDWSQDGETPLELGSKFDWWRQHACLEEEDVVRDKNRQLVYARFQNGWGGGIFFFPRASEDALFVGARALKSNALIGKRADRPDHRIWSRPYDAFVSDQISPARRWRAAKWAGIGGFCLCVLLAFSASRRKRYFSTGLAIGLVGLLSAFLARVFPSPEGVVSSVRLLQTPIRSCGLDAKATTSHRMVEWAFLDGFGDLENCTITGPDSGYVTPLHLHSGELETAGTILDATTTLRVRFKNFGISPLAPIFEAGQIVEWEPDSAKLLTVKVEEQDPAWKLPIGISKNDLVRVFGRMPNGAVYLEQSGDWSVISQPFADAPRIQRYESAAAAVHFIFPELTGLTLEARGKTLAWMLSRAAAGEGNRMLFFDVVETTQANDSFLIQVTGRGFERGHEFCFWDMPLVAAE